MTKIKRKVFFQKMRKRDGNMKKLQNLGKQNNLELQFNVYKSNPTLKKQLDRVRLKPGIRV